MDESRATEPDLVRLESEVAEILVRRASFARRCSEPGIRTRSTPSWPFSNYCKSRDSHDVEEVVELTRRARRRPKGSEARLDSGTSPASVALGSRSDVQGSQLK